MSLSSSRSGRRATWLLLVLAAAACSARQQQPVVQPAPTAPPPTVQPPQPVDVSGGLATSLTTPDHGGVKSAINERVAQDLEDATALPQLESSQDPPPPASPLDEIADLNLYSIEVDPGLEDRVGQQMRTARFDIPIVINDQVLRFLEYYRDRGREQIEKGLLRSARHMPLFREIFERHGVPLDLIYMAHVESLFNPRAYSRAHAKGIWQFVAGTARLYDLKIDWWLDERSDIAKSTDASARYLKALHDEFGDWYLTLAAYNGGPGRVRRAIRRGGHEDYWKLSARRLLPRETRNHVPSILAAIIIYKSPELYGFKVEDPGPVEFETIGIPYQVDLRVVADKAGIEVADLIELNPELRRGITPLNPGYRLKVPTGSGGEITDHLASLPPDERLKLQHHKVRQGETLSHIAGRYGVTIRSIADANQIRNVNRLKLGQDLIIPISGWVPSSALPRQAESATAPASYTVRRGDSLYAIARRYGLRVSDLMRWNNLTSATLIHPGQRLQLRGSEVSSQ